MDTAARARLDRWTQSLLDSADQDRHLDLAGGIAIPGDPVRIVFALVGGTKIALQRTPELTAVRRATRDALADGEHVLWLAIGMLAWTDRAANPHASPLVLWPVALDGFTLTSAPGRMPRINDALALRLKTDHELELAIDPELDLAALLDRAAAIAAENPGWSVERTAQLCTLSSIDLDLWRDVTQPRELSAPLAWLLGEAAPPALPALFGAPDPVPPLDADAAQLAAIATALHGGSFVLQGPPGTGKSQTIANLAALAASQGTSVLVVSDRVTALDAVQRRLAAVQLGDVCAIAGQPHERTSKPLGLTASATTMGRTRLVEVAAALDAHVAALHRVGALGMSVHEVLGRLVELRTTPNAALAEPDAPALDRATYDRRRRAACELAEAGAAVEPVGAHPWRASALTAWSAQSANRASQALETAGEIATTLASALVELGRLVPNVVARTPDQLRAIGQLAQLAAASPRPGADLLASPRSRVTSGSTDDIGERVALIRARGGGTLDVPRDPAGFVAIATRHRALVQEVEAVFSPELVAALDASELWTQLKRWTTSVAPLRYVALRTARAGVRAAALPDALPTDEAMMVALEAVIAERACRAALVAAAEPARRWFGELAGDPLALDLDKIEAAVAWAAELRRAYDRVTVTGGEHARTSAWRALIAQVAAGPTLLDRGDLATFARLGDAVARWEPAVAELAAATGIAQALLGAGHDHVAVLRTQIDALYRAVGSLGEWTRFHLARRAAMDAGLRAAVVAIERGDLPARELAFAWERATLLAWVHHAIDRTPELADFDGYAHHTTVASFADLDRGAMAVARGRMPRLAPCVLATPQAVARCGLGDFDLVIFDEASRLPVAHALPALARAKAAVIVGDVRQPLPADGSDGLLDVALAAGMPELVLSTHYRSRHHELFAFANQRFYFDLVEVLPAAQRTAELGLAWRRVDGTPDASGANRAEAEAIVADVVAKLREPGPHRSIAIVTLSRAQQTLIEDLLDAETFVRDSDEPVLVGTPDRLQGEERDLVYLSVGDGPAALGVYPQAERYLDIACTRARDQLVIVSSFAPEDVTTDAPWTARGIAELIQLAANGSPLTADLPPASPITAAIARALAERGWTVRHRVGHSTAAVELAVIDPDDPQRCVLAIEHDGAQYADGPATRDRDRLRGQLLAKLGWRVHRVWSLDWWHDAEREIQRLHGAIVAAIAASRRDRATADASGPRPQRRRLAQGSIPMDVQTADTQVAPASAPSVASGSGPTRNRSTARPPRSKDAPLLTGEGPPAEGPTDALATSDSAPLRVPRGAIAIGPYQAAAIPPGRRLPDDMFGGRHHAELGKVVEQVLAAEAPIHVELLARRVAAYFGVGRLTPRITECVRAALDGRGRFADEPDVVWRVDQDPGSVPAVRVAGSSAVACRDIAQIPLFEVAAAARIVAERATGLTTNELVRDCARLLGFARLDGRISERVALGIQLAAARELISVENDRAHPLTA